MSCSSTENQPISCQIKASILTVIFILMAVVLVIHLKSQLAQSQSMIVDIEKDARLELKEKVEKQVAESFAVVVTKDKAQLSPTVIFKQQAKQYLSNPKPVAIKTEAQKTNVAKLREIEAAKQATSNPFSL